MLYFHYPCLHVDFLPHDGCRCLFQDRWPARTSDLVIGDLHVFVFGSIVMERVPYQIVFQGGVDRHTSSNWHVELWGILIYCGVGHGERSRRVLELLVLFLPPCLKRRLGASSGLILLAVNVLSKELALRKNIFARISEAIEVLFLTAIPTFLQLQYRHV